MISSGLTAVSTGGNDNPVAVALSGPGIVSTTTPPGEYSKIVIDGSSSTGEGLFSVDGGQCWIHLPKAGSYMVTETTNSLAVQLRRIPGSGVDLAGVYVSAGG